MDTFSTSASSYMIQHVPVIDVDQIELREKIGKVTSFRNHNTDAAI